jgi:hypothetical protein
VEVPAEAANTLHRFRITPERDFGAKTVQLIKVNIPQFYHAARLPFSSDLNDAMKRKEYLYSSPCLFVSTSLGLLGHFPSGNLSLRHASSGVRDEGIGHLIILCIF